MCYSLNVLPVPCILHSFHLTIHLSDGPNQHRNGVFLFFFFYLTTSDSVHAQIFHNSLNSFPVDWHLGCSQSPAAANCAATGNPLQTEFPKPPSRVAGRSLPRAACIGHFCSRGPIVPHRGCSLVILPIVQWRTGRVVLLGLLPWTEKGGLCW